MKLFSHYRNAVIYPSMFILFFCFMYSIFYNYKSDGLTDIAALLMSIIPSLIFSLLMCVFSLTIFLNKFKKFNKYLICNILTWFLLPFVYIIIILVHDIQNRIKFEFGFGNGFIYLLIMTIPFIIGLCLTFMKYRQKIPTGNSV